MTNDSEAKATEIKTEVINDTQAYELSRSIGGYEVRWNIFGIKEDIAAEIQAMDAIFGVATTKAAPPAAAAQSAPRPSGGDDSAPMCPVHGKEMRKNKRGWYCPNKVSPGSEAWCDETKPV